MGRAVRIFAVHAAVATLALAAAHGATIGEPLSDRSVADALDALARRGLRVFFSSDLVRPSMRVQSEPVASDLPTMLAEVLAPHGLAARPGPGGAWLVVRDTSARSRQRVASAATEPVPSPSIDRPRPLEELVVTASQFELSRALAASQRTLTGRDLDELPEVGDDSLRAVARLPGTASNGFGARANIRGGAADETLIRLDGLRLYDPFHLKQFQGPFSAIDPRIVGSIDVYTGGFPAAFGDRLSGVVDVESMRAPASRYHEIGVSFFNTSLLSAGRFDDTRGEWLVSARRSNLDVLYDRLSPQPERPRYTDVFSRLSYRIGEHLEITGNLLRLEDDIGLADDEDREERAEARHRDDYLWIALDHTLGARTLGRTLISRTRLDSTRWGTTAKSGISAGELYDRRSFAIDQLDTSWSRLFGERTLLSVGAAALRMSGRYDYRDEVEPELVFDLPGAVIAASRAQDLSLSPDGRQYALFASLQHDWTDRFATELGLRWDSQNLAGRSDATLGPRLGVRYSLGPRTMARASFGRFYQSQAIHELSIGDGEAEYGRPQRADHLVVGLEHSFAQGPRLRLEVYDKRMDRLRPRFENLLNGRVLLPELKPDRISIAPEHARARGLELTIAGSEGPLRWWAAYSVSSVHDVLDARQVRRSWDQPRAFAAGLTWDTSRWTVSSALTYRSGWPIASVALDDSGALPTASIVERHARRLDAYRSLDLRVTRDIELERSALSVSLEITNALDYRNPCCIEYEVGDEDEAGLLVQDEIDYLSVVPSIAVRWTF